jgi:hypothetical protein
MAARKRTKQQRTEDLVRLAEAIAAFPPYKKQRELAELFGVSQQQISHDRAELKPFFDAARELWRQGIPLNDAYTVAAQGVREYYLGDTG